MKISVSSMFVLGIGFGDSTIVDEAGNHRDVISVYFLFLVVDIFKD